MTPLLALTLLAPAATGAVTFANGKPAGRAVVYLESSAKAQPVVNAVVDQRDHAFSPHVSVVTVGTKVRFPNNDMVYHNVFTEYHASRFDLGMYPRGASKFQTFDRPGVAVLMCTVHPDMSAYVVVVDTPYYAIADGKGRFSIPNVPPGRYKAQVWHENGEKASEDVTVGDGPLALRTKR